MMFNLAAPRPLAHGSKACLRKSFLARNNGSKTQGLKHLVSLHPPHERKAREMISLRPLRRETRMRTAVQRLLP